MVGITIPLVLAITFVTMYYWGVGLHKISLGSLIIALGLLVDDAIIAVEMMVRKLEEGYDKVRAATFAYEVTAMPMLTGTLITAVGFLPIGMAKSTVGEYTFAIFAVTAAALRDLLAGVGLLRALPGRAAAEGAPHAPASTAQAARALRHAVLQRAFARSWTGACEHRWITIGLTMAPFVLGLAGMGKVQQQFFPDSSRPEILVDLWLPEGRRRPATNEAVAKRVEARLMKRARRRHASRTWIGSGVPRFYLPLDQIFPQTNVSQIIVLPKDLAARESAAHAACRRCWPRSSRRCAAA